MKDGKENAAAIGFILLLVLIVVGIIYVIWAGYLEDLIGWALVICLGALIIYIFLHFIVGMFYFLESPDTVHEDSPATLDDIQPVDGAMNSDEQKKS